MAKGSRGGKRGGGNVSASKEMSQYNFSGTEKQVAWANDIVGGAWGTIERNFNNARANAEKYPSEREFFKSDAATWLQVASGYRDATHGITSAKQIIDERGRYDSSAVIRAFNALSQRKKGR